MARTSKTKVGGGPKQETMMRASEQGQAAIQRQGEQDIAREERQGERITQGVQNAAQLYDQNVQRGEDRAQQQSQFEATQAQRAAEMQQRGDIATEQTDLRAAEQGLQRNPRSQKLEEEIQRGQKQQQMPGEFDGQSFIPTEAKQKADQYGQETQRIKAETERDRVKAIQSNAKTAAIRALRTSDEESYKGARETYGSTVRKMGDKVSDIIKGAGNPLAKTSPDTLSFVKRLSIDNPDPELQQEVASGKLGPASARFLRGRMIYDQLDFVSTTGDWADFDMVDEAHPMYQQFQQLTVQAGDVLRQRQQIGAIVGITDLREANRMKRRIAAVSMKELALRKHTRMAMGAGGASPQAAPSAPAAPGAAPNVQSQQPAAAAAGPQRPFGPPR